jgi:hypothetical protein
MIGRKLNDKSKGSPLILRKGVETMSNPSQAAFIWAIILFSTIKRNCEETNEQSRCESTLFEPFWNSEKLGQ